MSYLRPELLGERSIALGGAVPATVVARLSSLGARTVVCEQLEDEAVLEWAQAEAPLDALVCGGWSLATLDQAWALIRSVANGALIPASRGAVVLIAPAPGQVDHAEAVRAALENLARTLSVEWSRFGITVTAITPGRQTSDEDVATLVAYLCSVAGRYFSGCRLDLGAVRE